jgi:1-aminocyclopropane-1-carboxylate deaminase/D-cysteine desulfhydrase-like pyridoxal-dependent ACC family enzyme
VSIREHCKIENITHIICTGGINSNNLAAAAILCAEAGISVTAFAVEDHTDAASPATGNRMLLRTALPPERLILVPRSEKDSIEERMHALAAKNAALGTRSLILLEGGGCRAAVPGCLTLADDIMRPRREWIDNKLPDHIFIDSGTALSAASLAAGLLRQGADQHSKLHIVQMAGFEEQVKLAFSQWVTPVTEVTWDQVNHFVRVYRPLSPRSYGATSAELFEFIRYMARTHGLLVDPIYSGKLFARAFDLIAGQNLRGRILVVHTGGISGLMGFPVNAN